MAGTTDKECTFKPNVYSKSVKKNDQSQMPGSANKWDELYLEHERKRGKVDRPQDEIDYERNHHEMRFAPEIHEINTRGTKRPIVAQGTKRGGPSARVHGEFLNNGQFGTLADSQADGEREAIISDLRFGTTSFEDQPPSNEKGRRSRSSREAAALRRPTSEVECLDMEVTIGD